MTVLVCGGRTYRRIAFAYATLSALHAETPITVLVQGGARGADWIGKSWAAAHGVPMREFRAQWGVYGRRAGFLRNREMLTVGQPALVVAFPGGPGTADMVRQARAAGVRILEPQEPLHSA